MSVYEEDLPLERLDQAPSVDTDDLVPVKRIGQSQLEFATLSQVVEGCSLAQSFIIHETDGPVIIPVDIEFDDLQFNVTEPTVGVARIALGSHAASHKHGGSDEVAVEAAAANAIPKSGAGGTLAKEWLPQATTSALGGVTLASNGGTVASTVVQATDARLSDARTPSAHKNSHEPGGSDAMTVDAVAATGSLRTLGTGEQQACSGNDSRLSNARTPSAHAASHKHGGSDEVAVATPAANAIPKAGSGGTLNTGWIPTLNQNTTGSAASLSGINDVSHGGTGVSTLAAHGVLVGNGTGVVAVTDAGTAGQVLTSNGAGADPTFQAAGASGDLFGTVVSTVDLTDEVLGLVTDLTVTIPAAGAYFVQAALGAEPTNSTNGGIQIDFGGTATIVNCVAATSRGVVFSDNEVVNDTAFWSEAVSVNGGDLYRIYIAAVVTFTSSGTFGIRAARAVSNANATRLSRPSSLILKKL